MSQENEGLLLEIWNSGVPPGNSLGRGGVDTSQRRAVDRYNSLGADIPRECKTTCFQERSFCFDIWAKHVYAALEHFSLKKFKDENILIVELLWHEMPSSKLQICHFPL